MKICFSPETINFIVKNYFEQKTKKMFMKIKQQQKMHHNFNSFFHLQIQIHSYIFSLNTFTNMQADLARTSSGHLIYLLHNHPCV